MTYSPFLPCITLCTLTSNLITLNVRIKAHNRNMFQKSFNYTGVKRIHYTVYFSLVLLACKKVNIIDTAKLQLLSTTIILNVKVSLYYFFKLNNARP